MMNDWTIEKKVFSRDPRTVMASGPFGANWSEMVRILENFELLVRYGPRFHFFTESGPFVDLLFLEKVYDD